MTTNSFIARNLAAQILCAHPRTISRNIKLKNLDEVPVKLFIKAFQVESAFFQDALAGRDYAVTLQQATRHLGLGKLHGGHIDGYGILNPVAKLGKGLRFSARRLGMITGDVSEASHGQA